MEVIMLTLWNPFVPVRTQSDSKMSTKNYFDRLFEDTFDTAFRDLFQVPTGWGIESKKNEDGSLAVAIDVPGIKENDLIIEIDEGILTVKGERKTATSSHSIHKAFSIPEGYDTDNIAAELKDGVLNIKIANKPLSPPKEVKRIAITSQK